MSANAIAVSSVSSASGEGRVSARVESRIAGLDELRGLSILWVMLCHGTSIWTWMPSSFSGFGFHGVVLFFIISGYLITKILIDVKGEPYYFSGFYINRFFRIWPLMIVALVVSALLWPEKMGAGIFNLLMINNYAYAYGIEPMVRTDVMWSLAIEEQFYLIWPAFTFLLGRKTLALSASLIVFVGLSFDAGLIPGGGGIIFKTTHGNMQYIAMGALIAIGPSGIKWLLAAWGTFFISYLKINGFLSGLESFRWIWYGVSFLLAVIVSFTVYQKPVLTWPPLASVGKLCYGLYLIHFFISWATLEYFGAGVVWQGVFYLIVSFLLAFLSYRFFEKPVLGFRRHVMAFERLRVLLFAVLGLMILVCVVSLIPTLKEIT